MAEFGAQFGHITCNCRKKSSRSKHRQSLLAMLSRRLTGSGQSCWSPVNRPELLLPKLSRRLTGLIQSCSPINSLELLPPKLSRRLTGSGQSYWKSGSKLELLLLKLTRWLKS